MQENTTLKPIEIKRYIVGNEKINAVNARDLWRNLDSKQEFSRWVQNRLKATMAEENIDYILVLESYKSQKISESAENSLISEVYEKVENNSFTSVEFAENSNQEVLENTDKIISKDEEALEYIIYNSCRIKKEVVENDPLEKGLRAILNFGHTIGHAVEKLMNFDLLHGECVALGMISACRMAVERGLVSESELEDMKKILTEYKLFNKISLSAVDFSIEDVLKATKSDKKMQGGKIKFILTKKVGKAEIYTDITNEEMIVGIKEIFEG